MHTYVHPCMHTDIQIQSLSHSLTHSLSHTYTTHEKLADPKENMFKKSQKTNHIQEDADAGPDDPISPAKNSQQIATLRDELSQAHELLQQREDEVRPSCVCVCVCLCLQRCTHTHSHTHTLTLVPSLVSYNMNKTPPSPPLPIHTHRCAHS